MLGAISVAFLKFSFTPLSLVIGAAAGAIASLVTIYWSLRRLIESNRYRCCEATRRNRALRRARVNRTMMILAVLCVLLQRIECRGDGQDRNGRAGSFFGCGMLLLCGSLVAAREGWPRAVRSNRSCLSWTVWLAWLAVCRNPMRSVLSISLLSVATFLIESMSVFQMSPTVQGIGGFDLIAESSQPIYRNPALANVRESQLGDKAKQISDATIVGFRSKLGEDASCNNLSKQLSRRSLVFHRSWVWSKCSRLRKLGFNGQLR